MNKKQERKAFILAAIIIVLGLICGALAGWPSWASTWGL